MPVTFPAHQGLVGFSKLWWPRYIDGTALCVGAAAPDMAYGFGDWSNHQSHTALGLVLWAVPFTLVACVVIRWRAAAGIFAHLPDAGPLRIRSYRVLGHRRPGWAITLASAVLGAGSHVVIDAFTHTGRWGANLLSLNGVVFAGPTRYDFTVARVGQYLGHGFGSLAFVWLVLLIARQHRLEEWYGEGLVEEARVHRPGIAERLVFWTVVGASTLAAGVVADDIGSSPLFLSISALIVSLITMGAAVPSASR